MLFRFAFCKSLEIRLFSCPPFLSHFLVSLSLSYLFISLSLSPSLSFFLSLLSLPSLFPLFLSLFLLSISLSLSKSSPLITLNANLWTFSFLFLLRKSYLFVNKVDGLNNYHHHTSLFILFYIYNEWYICKLLFLHPFFLYNFYNIVIFFFTEILKYCYTFF